MKNPLAVFRDRPIRDTLGLLALLMLFGLNAFHFSVYLDYVFYRELFGGFFVVLWLWTYVIRTDRPRYAMWQMNRSLFILLLFPILLAIWSLVDPGIPLYGSDDLAGVTEYAVVSPSLYVLRNALLYLPMVLYCYQRGLGAQDIRLIALVAILLAPFSINAYLQSGEFATLATLGILAETHGQGIAYNSYVPYLTFPILCGIYLLFAPGGWVLKGAILPFVLVTVMFMLVSSSRQSVLFVIVSLTAFLYFAPRGKLGARRWVIVGTAGLLGLFVFRSLTQDVQLGDEFLRRFSSLEGFFSQETSERGKAAMDGLALLEPWEWITGAGLTSVINSGPHNDYVRWTQRVGVILMIAGFLPFLLAFRASYRWVRQVSRQDNSLPLFLMLSTGFTLFHSFFGYPREDANQAVAVYLGLALWFGALRTASISASETRTRPGATRQLPPVASLSP